jgi:hypothetical protein
VPPKKPPPKTLGRLERGVLRALMWMVAVVVGRRLRKALRR